MGWRSLHHPLNRIPISLQTSCWRRYHYWKTTRHDEFRCLTPSKRVPANHHKTNCICSSRETLSSELLEQVQWRTTEFLPGRSSRHPHSRMHVCVALHYILVSSRTERASEINGTIPDRLPWKMHFSRYRSDSETLTGKGRWMGWSFHSICKYLEHRLCLERIRLECPKLLYCSLQCFNLQPSVNQVPGIPTSLDYLNLYSHSPSPPPFSLCRYAWSEFRNRI